MKSNPLTFEKRETPAGRVTENTELRPHRHLQAKPKPDKNRSTRNCHVGSTLTTTPASRGELNICPLTE
jgi:hypothetical protein